MILRTMVRGLVCALAVLAVRPAMAGDKKPVVFRQADYCGPWVTCPAAYVVPEGKRLVVEHVYWELMVHEGAALQVFLNVQQADDSILALPLFASRRATTDVGAGPLDIYVVSEQARAYAGHEHDGFATRVWVSSLLIPESAYELLYAPVIVGYLEPL